MTDEKCRELGIMTETELKEMDQRLDAIQIVGLADLVKYFKRIKLGQQKSPLLLQWAKWRGVKVIKIG